MGARKYSPEVHEFVKENVKKMRDRELSAACNEALGTHFTPASMKAFRGNYKYRNDLKQWSKEECWKYQTKYPQGMYEFIRDNSWGVSSQEMADMVNEKFGTNWTKEGMKQFRQRQGIKSGLTGWFQKGHPPGNKGKKLEEYIDDPERVAEIKRRISATQFKKGESPMNELPVGSIVVNGEGYKLRKKQMTGTLWERWEFLHRAVWREHYGEIPEGMMVIFRDSNRLNCDISNLALVTKGESAAMNRLGLRSEDPDLTDAGIALVKLRIALKQAKKRKKK